MQPVRAATPSQAANQAASAGPRKTAAYSEDALFSPPLPAFDPISEPMAPAAQFGASAFAKPKRKRGKIAAIVIGIIVGVLVIAYLAGVLFFSGHFFPNTYVADRDFSMMSLDAACDDIESDVSGYDLEVKGLGFQLTLTGDETGIDVDAQAIVDGMHSDASPWAWPIEVFRDHDESSKLAASYNQSGLEQAVRTAIDEFNADKTAPANATIAFSEADGEFVVSPEQAGTMLDSDAVVKAVDSAVISLERDVKLTKDHLRQPTVLSDDSRLQSACDQANGFLGADLSLTLGGTEIARVNASLIAQWVTLAEDLSVTLNQDAMGAWADELKAQYDTVGSERTYTRPDGKEITISGGTYGWEIDRDTLLATVQQAVPAQTVDVQEVPCLSTAVVPAADGTQDWGSRYIDIDLSEQHVRFYDDSGALVWESDCVSGAPTEDRETPTGVYKINAKESPSTLIGYENGQKTYETPVSYWMPFVRNSVGLHDANWQSSFGGTRYRDGAGSHGCVNLPVSKAGELYDLISVGDCVVCHW